jgi:isoquinoline 1-oxidoreductase beta subunit
MTTAMRVTRRDFLKVTAAAGGGLLIAVTLPGCRRGFGEEASSDPTIFARIEPDNGTTITIAKSEMGQGVRTSLAMLVAEELDADWSRVKLEQAPFDPRYGSQGTGGSSSTPEGWGTLRAAGAGVRAMLVAAAAQRLGVPKEELRTESSFVIHDRSNQRVSYASLAAAAAQIAIPKNVPLKKRSDYRILGKPTRHLDAPDITHGKAIYGIDVKVPGMLYASVERTRVFGGKVKSFDATAALKVPGVVQVVEVPEVGGDVRVHAGVAVVAENTWAAMEGRRALRIEWEPGPHAEESSESYRTFMLDALSKPGKETVNKYGDPDAVLAQASDVISATYELPFISHATMEPMNATAHVQGNRAELWSPTQFPDWAARAVAQTLKLDLKNVKVNVPLLGGGYGRRINPDFSVEAALVSQKLQRPVKVVWTRTDDLQHDFFRPCAAHRIEATLGTDGLPRAWRHRMSTPAISATIGDPEGTGYGSGESNGASDMSYRIPNRSCEYTMLPSGVTRGWWRAVHTTHTVFAVESFIDELAARAGKDPVEYRLALIDQLPKGAPNQSKEFPFKPERLKGVLTLAAEKAGWGKPLPPGHALGVACAIDHLSYAAEVVEVSEVEGKIRIHRVVCAADCGPVINPDGARSQLQGGITQALSVALKERITVSGGAVEQGNYDRYPILRIHEAPPVIETYFAETDTHPTGLGEPAVPPLAPALANAIARATGKRLRSLPLQIQLG